MAVDPIIQEKANFIRGSKEGLEVRDSLASGLEAMSEVVVGNTGRQDDVETQFQSIMDAQAEIEPSGVEVGAARVDAEGVTHPNLKTRLDNKEQEFTEQLAKTNTNKADKTFVDNEIERLETDKISSHNVNRIITSTNYPVETDGNTGDLWVVLADEYVNDKVSTETFNKATGLGFGDSDVVAGFRMGAQSVSPGSQGFLTRIKVPIWKPTGQTSGDLRKIFVELWSADSTLKPLEKISTSMNRVDGNLIPTVKNPPQWFDFKFNNVFIDSAKKYCIVIRLDGRTRVTGGETYYWQSNAIAPDENHIIYYQNLDGEWLTIGGVLGYELHQI